MQQSTQKPHRYRRSSRKGFIKYRVAFAAILLSCFYLAHLYSSTYNSGDSKNARASESGGGGTRNRHLLELSVMEQLDGHGCGDDSTMGKAGLVVWIIGIIFTFLGLALVCDDYFVDSLERISLALNLSDDVAGATFMAAGSSAPELFTSLVGVFFKNPDDNPGPGTIVGSAVFNITIIIGITTLLANEALQLDWWPLTRDSACYSISIILMITVFVGTTAGQIDWWEGLIMWLAYFGYILVMKFNEKIINKIEQSRDGVVRDEHDELKKIADGKETLPFRRFRGMNPRLRSFYRAGMEAVQKWSLEKSEIDAERRHSAIEQKRAMKFKAAGKAVVIANRFAQVAEDDKDEDEEEDNGLPDTTMGWILYIAMYPWTFMFRYTIPNSADPRWATWYPMTFTMSILWIGVISFFMVDFAVKSGACIGLSANVMGLTVLAAGTSVPDALSSVLVARDGKGDMAVSNAIGSNVFDILLGLGFPWFLGALIFDEPIAINTEGILIYTLILFGVLLLLIGILLYSKFILRKWVGYVLLSSYGAFFIFSLIYDTIVVN